MSKRKILLCLAIVSLILLVIGFFAGPIGKSILEKILGEGNLPAWLNWLSISSPHLELPSQTVFHISGFPITNTVIAGWLTVIILVILSLIVSRRLKIIPGRLQTAFEFLLGWLYNFCTSAAGEKNGRRFFPIVTTIFLFVAFNAWLGLVPGYGSITVHTAEGEVHLLRPANTDINTPLAIAIVSVIAVQFFGLRTLGRHYVAKFFNFGGFFRNAGQVFRGKVGSGLSGMFTGVIEIFVGLLELLSEFIRILSFTFRLFGNMTAGEALILVAFFLVPFLFALPFYGLELLIGFLQALIFSGLTLIFLTLAVSSHDEHEA
ncbi:MAG: F0F1 ATP synthase subunit A [Chloroflexota bacterium]